MAWSNRESPCTIDTDEGPVLFWVLFPQGFSENFTRGKGETTKLRLGVDWDEAGAFKAHSLGYSEAVEIVPTPTPPLPAVKLSRKIPLILPWTEGGSDQYLDDLAEPQVVNESGAGGALDGIGVDETYAGGWPKAAGVSYAGTFLALPFRVSTDYLIQQNGHTELDRYVVRRRQDVPRERRVNVYTLTYGPTSPPNRPSLPEQGFVPDLQRIYYYTWKEIPTEHIPNAAISACLLKINDATFDSLAFLSPGFGGPFDASTVLFTKVDGLDQPYKMASGKWAVDITYTFKFQPWTWNKARIFKNANATNASFDEVDIYVGQTTNRPYNTADFSTLFRIE